MHHAGARKKKVKHKTEIDLLFNRVTCSKCKWTYTSYSGDVRKMEQSADDHEKSHG